MCSHVISYRISVSVSVSMHPWLSSLHVHEREQNCTHFSFYLVICSFVISKFLNWHCSFRQHAPNPPRHSTTYKTQVSRNANIAKLEAGYLFPEVCGVVMFFHFQMWRCPFDLLVQLFQMWRCPFEVNPLHSEFNLF
ncbi:hypothetical protein DVH24_034453 [Malus domestica]|uniref:Uncharacterized protein n=1 Tax=Malus domestica TaxID=3750 RepID=A0A498J173_MALDO|nr:hypothetical protein DVH24_034453 [Malus domestica]